MGFLDVIPILEVIFSFTYMSIHYVYLLDYLEKGNSPKHQSEGT